MDEKTISTNNAVIAISSSSKDLDGDIDNRFGRCQYFILVSIDNEKIISFETIENIKADMRGGVGVAVAKMLADHSVDVIISGNIGPRAMDILRQFNIPIYHATGSKHEAIKNLIEKKLPLIQGE